MDNSVEIYVPEMDFEPCKDCGCVCRACHAGYNLSLHQEIEKLKSDLVARNNHIHQMEAMFLADCHQARNENWHDEMSHLKLKHDWMAEAHRRVQKVNQNLEDKLLKMADQGAYDMNRLTQEIQRLSNQLSESFLAMEHLHSENKRLLSDCTLALRLLECRQAYTSEDPVVPLQKLPRDFKNDVEAVCDSANNSPTMRRRTADKPKSKPPRTQWFEWLPLGVTYPPTAVGISSSKLVQKKSEEDIDRNDEEIPIQVMKAVPMSVIMQILSVRKEGFTQHSASVVCHKCSRDRNDMTNRLSGQGDGNSEIIDLDAAMLMTSSPQSMC